MLDVVPARANWEKWRRSSRPEVMMWSWGLPRQWAEVRGGMSEVVWERWATLLVLAMEAAPPVEQPSVVMTRWTSPVPGRRQERKKRASSYRPHQGAIFLRHGHQHGRCHFPGHIASQLSTVAVDPARLPRPYFAGRCRVLWVSRLPSGASARLSCRGLDLASPKGRERRQ